MSQRPSFNAFARHAGMTPSAVQTGDPAAIQALYVALGEDLWQLAQEDLALIPVLSAPETAPVVAGCVPPRGLILDAGCGPNPATALQIARRPGCSVVGVDVGLGTVRTAARIAGASGLDLLGVCADLQRLPFRAGVFDAAVCDDTVEHLPDAPAGVGELGRVLRTGGQAVIATPNRWSAAVVRSRLQDRLAGHPQPPSAYFAAASHLREYTWRDLEDLLRPSLRVRRRIPVGWSNRRLRHLNRLFRLPGGRQLCQTLVVVAEPR